MIQPKRWNGLLAIGLAGQALLFPLMKKTNR